MTTLVVLWCRCEGGGGGGGGVEGSGGGSNIGADGCSWSLVLPSEKQGIQLKIVW